MGVSRHVDLHDLAERIRSIESRRSSGLVSRHDVGEPLEGDYWATGWAEVDAAIGGGLPVGGLHEWFGVAYPGESDRQWSPPLCILAHLAWQRLERHSSPLWTVWIGRRCHPYPRVLVRSDGSDRRLLEQSLFIAPRDSAGRLWAIDLALRSPAVGIVIADGSGFDRAATQRIQMLARTQMKSVLSVCPVRQEGELSAAQTRWRVGNLPPVEKVATCGVSPRWSVQLLRCKGLRPTDQVWSLEWNRAEGAIHLSTGLADLAGSSEKPSQRATPPRKQQTA